MKNRLPSHDSQCQGVSTSLSLSVSATETKFFFDTASFVLLPSLHLHFASAKERISAVACFFFRQLLSRGQSRVFTCSPPSSTPFCPCPAMSITAARDFLASLERRQEASKLGREVTPESYARVKAIITETILLCPTSFNTQSTRVVILYGADHLALWSLLCECGVHSDDEAMHFKHHILPAMGTAVFFEEGADTDALAKRFPQYADVLPVFEDQTSGMAQFAVSAALAQEGLATAVYHMASSSSTSPSVEERVRGLLQVPASWRMKAQMAFGTVKEEPGRSGTVMVSDAERCMVLRH